MHTSFTRACSLNQTFADSESLLIQTARKALSSGMPLTSRCTGGIGTELFRFLKMVKISWDVLKWRTASRLNYRRI